MSEQRADEDGGATDGTRMLGYGVDIGGSGIKGALVDLDAGALASERTKVLTPSPAVPEDVVAIIASIVKESGWDGPFGCTFPGIVKHGTLFSAANLGQQWMGVHLGDLLTEATGHPCIVLNDADAAGLAELRFGAAKGRKGLVLVTTLGTGIGSALLYDGVLIPNSELGHLQLHGHSGPAEKYAASSAKELQGLSYKQWAKRLQEYYSHVEFLLSPEVIVVGGGISRKAERFLPYLDLISEIVPATLRNEAGIIGAAMAAHEAAVSA